jgi:hypothetical protein
MKMTPGETVVPTCTVTHSRRRIFSHQLETASRPLTAMSATRIIEKRGQNSFSPNFRVPYAEAATYYKICCRRYLQQKVYV